MVLMLQSGKVATTVNDFTVVRLQLSPQPSYPQTATHFLYLRANAPKIPTTDTPREVFLVNVPIDATDVHLRSLFADQLGGARIEGVAWEGARAGKGLTAPVAPAKSKKRKRERDEEEEEGRGGREVGVLPEVWTRETHRSGGTAVVTFVDAASAALAVREARRATKSGRELAWAGGDDGGAGVEAGVPALGAARYRAHQELRYPDPSVLRESVDGFMAAFAAAEALRARALARQRQVPDADGFITVTRGGRRATAKEDDAKAKEEEFKRREKSRVRDDFYRFQTRERKKEQARDLVKGYEEDARKLEEMRRRRGKLRPE